MQIRLAIMMFLQFFIWGSWQVTAAKYLGLIGFTAKQIGLIYAVGPIAGIISPFFVGIVADRFFATERVLGALHILGAILMFATMSLMQQASPSATQITAMIFVYMLTYFPTIALANSLAMHTMSDPARQFPAVRVFGTIGWIAAGIMLSLTGWGDNAGMFYQASGAALALGIYSFTLPHIPPPARGQQVSFRQLLGLDAIVLFKNRNYLIFLISSFLICIPLAFYYQLAEKTVTQTGIPNPAFRMTFGQMSEILFMIVMPLFFARLGVKWMLLAGMLAWVVRYALFAIGAPDSVAWMVMAGVLLHGICYDFFFVTGQIYTDALAPPQIRSQAQGLLVLFTLGLGMSIGALVAGHVEQRFTPEAYKVANAKRQAAADEVNSIETKLAQANAEKSAEEEKTLKTELAAARTKLNDLTVAALRTLDWRMIWGIPAAIAAAIMLVFAVAFKEEGVRTAAKHGSA